jgi:DNA-binding winged helix-turn-helix (wHTH) protein
MTLDTQSSGILRFATFEVDLRAGELRKLGKRIKVQEQPFHVLTVLLQRPGEVVTREELRNQNWPPDTFVDFDNSLNTAINKLREALGDSADNPRFIETLPRRGYRFLAPVSSDQRKRSRSIAAKWVGAGATTVVVVVAVAGGLFSRSRQPGA